MSPPTSPSNSSAGTEDCSLALSYESASDSDTSLVYYAFGSDISDNTVERDPYSSESDVWSDDERWERAIANKPSAEDRDVLLEDSLFGSGAEDLDGSIPSDLSSLYLFSENEGDDNGYTTSSDGDLDSGYDADSPNEDQLPVTWVYSSDSEDDNLEDGPYGSPTTQDFSSQPPPNGIHVTEEEDWERLFPSSDDGVDRDGCIGQ